MKTVSLTVRRIPDHVKQTLRVRAAERGRSLEEEVRQILLSVATERTRGRLNLAEKIAEIVDPMGGVELDLPDRAPMRQPPRFDE